MRLLIVEKHDIYKRLIAADGVDISNTEIVSLCGMGFWDWDLPLISIDQVPFIDHLPEQKKAREFNFLASMNLFFDNNKTCLINKDYNGHEGTPGFSQQIVDHIKSNLQQYTEIVLFVDMDERGFGIAKIFLDKILGNSDLKSFASYKNTPIYFMDYSDLSNKSISFSWSDRHETRFSENTKAGSFLKRWAIKRHFDYLWSINSAAAFNPIFERLDIEKPVLFSKYQLMVLFIVWGYGNEGVSIENLLRSMSDWPATADNELVNYRAEIGSASSRSTIIDQLKSLSLIDYLPSDEKTLIVTNKGIRFLLLMSPESFDPNLPNNLRKWSENNDYDAVNEYISKFFSRQLNYQSQAIQSTK